ncbi:MAG: Crp/Fnr family transcriptional regulator [Pseudomonadota bacterium]
MVTDGRDGFPDTGPISDLRHLDLSDSWLAGVPDTVARALLARCEPVDVARGDGLYEIGAPAKEVYLICDGVIGLQGLVDPKRIGHLLGPSAWFGEGAVLAGLPRLLSVTAMTDARLVRLPMSEIDSAGQSYPGLWRGLAVLSAHNCAVTTRVARDLMISRPEDRVAAVLARLQDGLGGAQDIPLSQEQLADMCVLSRGAVSRILARMEAAGTVRRGYRALRWLGQAAD